MITFTSVPALVALLFKVVLLGYSAQRVTRNATTRLFLVLLAVLAAQNLVEFFGFNHLAQHGMTLTMQLVGYAYIGLLIPAIALILHISLRLSFDLPAGDPRAGYQYLLYVPAAGLLWLLVFTDTLVLGFRPFQDTVLREPGPWYFLFETYLEVYLLAALANLLYGARSSRTPAIARARNRLWLVAILPTAALFIYLIAANHFGWTRLTSTFYIPITLTFFLLVTTYATYQYRLLDIEFYIPGSPLRRRKTAFHRRIRATIAAIAGLRAVPDILPLIADALRCPVVMIGGVQPEVALAGDAQPSGTSARAAVSLAEFPRSALEKIADIVIAREISEAMPETYALMKKHGVAAIVPFDSHVEEAASWMLLGDHFSEQVYTPLDFRLVEQLFERIGDRMGDSLLVVRTRLAEAHREIHQSKLRLAQAWQDLVRMRAKVSELNHEVRHLRAKNARLLREKFAAASAGAESDGPEFDAARHMTLADYVSACEATVISDALRYSEGDLSRAAQMLDMESGALRDKLEQYGLTGMALT